MVDSVRGSVLGVVPSCLALVALACSGPIADPPADADDEGSRGVGESTSPSDPPGESSEADPTSGSEPGTPPDVPPEEDVEAVELRIDGFSVLGLETYYACFDFTFELDELGHIVRFKPALDKAQFVHHFVLTMTDEPSGQPQGFPCFDLEGDIVWAWAPGQIEFVYPPEAGYLIGDAPGGRVNLRLQVHYNNPAGITGDVDRSGFDMWVTRDLREFDAGTLVFGDVEQIEIPPGLPSYEHVGRCRSEVTQSRFEHPLNVFGASMHAHTLGRLLYSEIFRDGRMIGELNRDDPYDFDLQTFKPVDLVLQPGDEIVNHCFYDSSGQTETTFGGPGTREEMCWDTIVYYPKLANGFDYCSSSN